MYRFGLISCVLLIGNAVNAHAAVIYNFENPYSLGGLNAQVGWTAGASATVVNAGTPAFGSQYVQIKDDHSATNTLVGSGFGSVTTLSYQTALSSPGGNTYAEIQLFDSLNVNYAHLGFQDATDAYYVYGPAINMTNAAVAVDTVYSVDVTLNFVSQQYRVTFNSGAAYDSGFVSLKAATSAVLAGGGYIRLLGGTTSPNNGTGYYDNISVSSVPEPTTALLATLGFLGFAFSRRRKLGVK